MIVWIASYPRSGNTFACITLQNRFQITGWAVYSNSGPPESTSEGVQRMSVEEMAASPEVYFVKTHELPGDDSWPAIYLVRDGRDVLVSYAHYALLTRQGIPEGSNRKMFLSRLKLMITNPGFFGGWGAHVLAWTRRAAPTAIIRFEDLVRRPAEELRRALAEIGQNAAPSTQRDVPSFEELHRDHPHMFRKGKSGAWKEEMPVHLQITFWRRHGGAMRKFGYGRGRGEGEPAWGLLRLGLWAMRQANWNLRKGWREWALIRSGAAGIGGNTA